VLTHFTVLTHVDIVSVTKRFLSDGSLLVPSLVLLIVLPSLTRSFRPSLGTVIPRHPYIEVLLLVL
jgi:hypothetical protein